MATTNPFDLLGDDDNDDPSLLLAAQQHKVAAVTATKKSAPAAAAPAKAAKLPTKPLPPAQAVREARADGGRGGGRGAGRGYGRGRGGPGGFNRNDNTEAAYGNDNRAPYRPSEDRESGRPSERRFSRGGFGRRGGFSNGEAGEGERPRRVYDRRSGTGRGSDIKRDGSGSGNWGTPADDLAPETEEPAAENDAPAAAEKPLNDGENADLNKENPANEAEEKEKEEEEKQMTLEEYEKVLEEKRKALLSLKVEERKVDATVFESMQVISKKKDNEEVFAKLGADKDKRKEAADKEEKTRKSLSINEFLKPADGESYRGGRGGRGRGRGGPRGGGFSGGGRGYSGPAPSIEDPGHFPSLGAK